MPSKLENTENGTGMPELKVQRQRSTSFLPKIVIAVLSVSLIVTAVLFVIFVALYASKSSSSSSSTSDMCVSEACLDLAVQIKGAMDESVDPCDDFYNFTCGNWPAFNHIPEDFYGTGALRQQQFSVYSDLAEVLETDFTEGNSVLTELSDFYDSCIAAQLMTEEEFVSNLIPVIRQVYQDLGGWSLVNIPGDGTWSVNSSQFIREKLMGSNAFYRLIPFMNVDTREYMLLILQGGLSLDDPALYNKANSTEMLFETMSTILGELAQRPVSSDAIQDIVDFETSLARIWEDTTDLTVSDVYNSIYTVQQLYSLWPYHDWLGVLQGIFGPLGVDFGLSSSVSLVTPNYFRRLTDLVESIPAVTLENYAKWAMTWQLAEVFLPDSTIRDSLILFRQLVLGKPSMDQKQECVQIVDEALPLALGRVYAQYILPAGYKETGMALVTQVREGLRQRMMEVDWLDSETRQLALEKLEAIESRVAYPEKTFDDSYFEMLYGVYNFNKEQYVQNTLQYINETVKQRYSLIFKPFDRTEWVVSPSTVNAYYHRVFNSITILEAIMRTPSFSADWPLSMQYGGLGMILGHEFTHGFDNNGRQFDKDGRRRMWWSEAAVNTFNDRTQCFVDQYSQYQLFGIQVNGSKTLGENIADNGGIRASYEAYQKVAGRSKQLPGLTEYTNDQLFFIAFGQLWCSYNNLNSFKTAVLTGVHSPGRFRIIGTLSNNEAFSEAFNCPSGSPMNPTNKCVLW